MDNENLEKVFFSDVTLLITHYNRSNSLKRLLDTLLDLGVSFREIVVSDDCSAKLHLDKLQAWRDEYSFTLVSSEKRIGNNLNKGSV